MEKMRSAIYCRVAHEDDLALENQKNNLMNYALGQGYNVKAVVAETASGLSADRSGLNEVLAAVSDGGVDAVLVDGISRIHRNSVSVYGFMDYLKSYNVELLSRKDNFGSAEADAIRAMIKSAGRKARTKQV